MSEQSGKGWQSDLLLGLPILGVVVIARLLGLFQTAELQALDFGLRSRPGESADERITIVSITEEDIQAIGTYPISDGDIAALIEKIDQHQPRAIGLDIFRDLPVEPGHADFSSLVKRLDHLVVISKLLPPSSIKPPPAAAADQVGFADALPDVDGFVRRSLLGSLDQQSGEYKLSFTLQLAQRYLAQEGLSLANGIRDPAAMRFGDTELVRVRPNTGGYVGVDAGGEQIMLNFRSGQNRFKTITYQDVLAGDFAATDIADRVVLVGLTAPSVKDIVNTAAIEGVNPGLVTGIEVQAHAVSQILSAVLDERSLINVLPDGLEYVWIVGWGLLGVTLARKGSKMKAAKNEGSKIRRSKIRGTKIIYFTLGTALLSGGLLIVSYALLVSGWWVPVVPTGIAFVLNSLILYPSFQAQQDLEQRLEDRQRLIERTFDQIHNGPLQKLAVVLKQIPEVNRYTDLEQDLRSLNRDLRGIYESLKEEFLSTTDCLQLANHCKVRLDQPLHEILYEVYEHTLKRQEFPCLKGIKFYIRKFEPMTAPGLSSELKCEIGRFLEESICNVGKYAEGCSRLTVICIQQETENVVQVIDNGISTAEGRHETCQRQREGRGTQQARSLARQLRGRFTRQAHPPRGTIAELRWPIQHKAAFRK